MSTSLMESRKIGAFTYHVSPLGTEVGRKLFFKLFKIVGPAGITILRSMAGTGVGTGAWDPTQFMAKVGPALAADALTELVAGLNAEDFEVFYTEFLKTTFREDESGGGKVPAENIKGLIFQRDYGSMTRWLAFCLTYNFSSFLDGLGITSHPT